MKAAAQSPERAKFDQGKALAENSKDAEGVDQGYRLMEEAASQGGPDLLFELTMLYIQGAGAKPPGPRRAMKISSLLTQAADQDHLAAAKMLARMYISEQYVDSRTRRTVQGPEANKAAQHYLEKCIALGDADSRATLERMYETGRATPPPPARDKAPVR